MAHQSTSERGVRESGPFSRAGNMIGANEEIGQARKRDRLLAYSVVGLVILLGAIGVLSGVGRAWGVWGVLGLLVALGILGGLAYNYVRVHRRA